MKLYEDTKENRVLCPTCAKQRGLRAIDIADEPARCEDCGERTMVRTPTTPAIEMIAIGYGLTHQQLAVIAAQHGIVYAYPADMGWFRPGVAYHPSSAWTPDDAQRLQQIASHA